MKTTRRQLRQIIKAELYRLHERVIEETNDEALAAVLASDAETQIDAIGGGLKDAAFKGVLFDMIAGLPAHLRDEFIEKVFTSTDPDVDVSEIEMEDLLDYMIDGTLEADMDKWAEWSAEAIALADKQSKEASDQGGDIPDAADDAGPVKGGDTKPKPKYSGPKAKGRKRYIVTSQLVKYHSEGDADFDSAVFWLVDTHDGKEFKIHGNDLPTMLNSSEGEIEIHDISNPPSSDQSHLVASIDDKEFRLPSKRIGEATIRKVINKLIAEAPVHGHHPEESYEEGTIENLMLDKETTHGGWPEGPSRSFTSNKKVNAQIADWLKDMKMVKK